VSSGNGTVNDQASRLMKRNETARRDDGQIRNFKNQKTKKNKTKTKRRKDKTKDKKTSKTKTMTKQSDNQKRRKRQNKLRREI